MERWHWVDRAKGIGIVLVVISHVLRGLVEARLVPTGVLQSTVDYALYTFHMPLFFMLAGLFVEGSYRKGTARYWKSKVLSIAWPYLLWSVLHGSLLLVFSGFINGTASAGRITSILWHPIAPFWFLYALFLCHALYALLRRFELRFVLAGATVAYLLLEAFRGGTHDVNLLWDTGRGFFFYLVGVALAARGALTLQHPTRVAAMAATAFVLAVAACRAAGIAYEAALPAAFAGMVLAVATSQIAMRDGGVLAFLGRHSMAILVMHVMVASGLRIALVKLTPIRDPLVLLALGTTVGLIVPVMAGILAQRLGIARWLGISAERG